MKFDVDYAERAVADEIKRLYKDKPPAGLIPSVSINPKTAARLASKASPPSPS